MLEKIDMSFQQALERKKIELRDINQHTSPVRYWKWLRKHQK